MVGEAFDGDMHTIKDGALGRFMKMRKWLFLTAICLLLIHSGVLDFAGIAKALFVPSLSREALHFGLSVAAAYQAIMLALVLYQLSAVYRQSLLERFDRTGTFTRGDLVSSRHQKLDVTQTRARVAELIAEVGPVGSEKEKESIATEATKIDARNSEMARLKMLEENLPHQLKWERKVLYPEIAIDMMRIVPTTGFFLVALIFYTRFWPTL